jgi:hypothetical protein
LFYKGYVFVSCSSLFISLVTLLLPFLVLLDKPDMTASQRKIEIPGSDLQQRSICEQHAAVSVICKPKGEVFVARSSPTPGGCQFSQITFEVSRTEPGVLCAFARAIAVFRLFNITRTFVYQCHVQIIKRESQQEGDQAHEEAVKEDKYGGIAAQLAPEDSEKSKQLYKRHFLMQIASQHHLRVQMRSKQVWLCCVTCSAIRSSSIVSFYTNCAVTHIALFSSQRTMLQGTKPWRSTATSSASPIQRSTKLQLNKPRQLWQR